jgi:GMP synthase (glutamine-hydrolysing)
MTQPNQRVPVMIHYFQHVPFEGIGSIAQWAETRGHAVTCTRFYLGEKPPPVDAVDWLIVMGGPMSVNDDNDYPWLTDEMAWIDRAIERGAIVLGICLGAQLIARALGARVSPNARREIGWYPVEKVASAAISPMGHAMADGLTAFHWHGETFDLPPGSVHLYRSQACENQGFSYGGRVVGLQYHMETTIQSVQALVANCSDELVEGPYIQTREEMLGDPSRFDRINAEMVRLLDHLHSLGRP